MDPVSFACAPELLVADISTKTLELDSGPANLTCIVFSDPPTKPRWFHDGREIPWGSKDMVIRTTGMCHRYTDRQVFTATGKTDGSLEETRGLRGMVFKLAGNHHDGGEIPWGSKEMPRQYPVTTH